MSDELPKGWANASYAKSWSIMQPGSPAKKNGEGGVPQCGWTSIGMEGRLVLTSST